MRTRLLAITTAALGASLGGSLAAGAGGVAAASAATAQATGAIGGTATFSGAAPAGQPAQLAADPYCAAAHTEPVVVQPVRADADGRLADVIVWVRDAPAGPPPQESALLHQEGCVYHPHVLAVRAGQSVVFRNDDMTLHNINVQPRENPAFNVGQPIRGMQIERRFDNPEVGIPIRCDVHPWMTAYMAVFAHEHFAVTDDDGTFVLDGLPAGDWVLETWHPILGSQTRQVTVAPGETATVALDFGG